jgi:hypothetical protein
VFRVDFTGVPVHFTAKKSSEFHLTFKRRPLHLGLSMSAFKRISILSVVFAWGAGLLNAAPVAPLHLQITLALPVTTVDFSDLDLRDENNQPIAAPEIRRRFEDALNDNIDRLLMDNLTPLRHALVDALSHDVNAFSDWIGRAVESAHRLLWTAGGDSHRWTLSPALASGLTRTILSQAMTTLAPQFVFLSVLLTSTTRLLR